MKSNILLDYNENTKQIEEEEKSRFIRMILEQSFDGTAVIDQLNAIYDTDGPLSVRQKIALRNILTTYGIVIIDGIVDGALKIYLDNEQIAEFEKPIYRLKTDMDATNPKKRVYIEMEVNCWSSFDKEQEA